MEESNRFCYHCGLPNNSTKATRNGHYFCCFGCVLAYEVTGGRGDEGETLWLLARMGISFFFAMNVVLLSAADYLYPFEENIKITVNYVKMVLATPVILLLGLPILRNSLNSISDYILDLDTLIVLGTFSAFALSVFSTLTGESDVYYDTAVMILVLVTLGRYLEANSKLNASETLKRFLDLEPDEATVIRGQEEIISPVESIKVGDSLKVYPGGNFPVDGIVTRGESSVNESMLTGESKPVFKSPGMQVSSGTSNIDGVLFIRATRVDKDKTVSRLAELVKQSRMHKPQIQRISDRISQIFIPLIIVLGICAFAFWYFNSGFDKALLVFLSILLISCPCALGIATPRATWISIGKATENGILIKRGDILEKLSNIKNIFFDKTGTLTSKELAYTESYTGRESQLDNQKLIDIISSAESGSEHPVALSLVKYAKLNGYPQHEVKKFRTYPGLGISAIVEGKTYFVGGIRLMQRSGLSVKDELLNKRIKDMEKRGISVVYCGWNGGVNGVIGFSECLRDEAYETVSELRSLGTDIIVLTGDGKYPSLSLADKLGVEIRYALTPEEKVGEIKKYGGKGRVSVMIGDGINDAPALNAADVGIALGCGTEITRESADVSFLDDDLGKIPWLLGLSKTTTSKIRQNLFWAFIYNFIGLGLAVAGVLQPVISALAMVMSSVFVMGNSLSIKRHKYYR